MWTDNVACHSSKVSSHQLPIPLKVCPKRNSRYRKTGSIMDTDPRKLICISKEQFLEPSLTFSHSQESDEIIKLRCPVFVINSSFLMFDYMFCFVFCFFPIKNSYISWPIPYLFGAVLRTVLEAVSQALGFYKFP